MKKKYAEEIVEEVRRDFEQRREKRKALELQWRLNMNFLSGDQYCEITPTGDIDDYGKQYWWQQREVFNQIASVVETRLAKLARVKTGIVVRPASDDDSDVYAAKLSTQVLKAAGESVDLVKLINAASVWSEATGTCFIKVGWDAGAGKVIGVDKKGGRLHEGDLTVSIVPPFEIFPDNLLAGEPENCRSIIHAKAYHVDEVRDIWGEEVKGEDVTIQNSFLRYGRTCLRAMDADGLLVRNCLMENSREFLMKVGSDEFASTDPEKRVTYQHKGDYYSGAISGLMDRSYGAADRLFNEALGLQEGDDPEGTLEPAMVIQEALDGDPGLEPAEIVVEDTQFGRSGLFPIAFDSLFNGPFLYNGLPSLIQDVFSIFTEFDIPFPSIVPDQVGGTSRASELTLRGDCRFYDWKNVETIDASCLIEERIGDFLGLILGTASGETVPRIPIDSYFPIKALLLEEAERLGYSYHVPVEDGEEGEEDIYLCPVAGYYGGGRNDSLLIHEESGIGEEIAIDFARSSITGEGLASAGSDTAEPTRASPRPSGSRPTSRSS